MAIRKTAGREGSSGGRHFLLGPFRDDLLLNAGRNAAVGMKFQGEGPLSLCQAPQVGGIAKRLSQWNLAADQDTAAKVIHRDNDPAATSQVTMPAAAMVKITRTLIPRDLGSGGLN